MQDAELFIHLAEIAGVFVAFGALIAVRSGGASGPVEVGLTRGMVAFGVLAMVGGFAPLALDFLGLVQHQVWALSSAIVLVGLTLAVVVQVRTPEYRSNWRTSMEDVRTGVRSRWSESAEGIVFVVWMLAILLAPIVILLGLAPDLDAGLYFTTVVLILLGAAWLLLSLVFTPRPPDEASNDLQGGRELRTSGR
jgi:hypothetical protein